MSYVRRIWVVVIHRINSSITRHLQSHFIPSCWCWSCSILIKINGLESKERRKQRKKRKRLPSSSHLTPFSDRFKMRPPPPLSPMLNAHATTNIKYAAFVSHSQRAPVSFRFNCNDDELIDRSIVVVRNFFFCFCILPVRPSVRPCIGKALSTSLPVSRLEAAVVVRIINWERVCHLECVPIAHAVEKWRIWRFNLLGEERGIGPKGGTSFSFFFSFLFLVFFFQIPNFETLSSSYSSDAATSLFFVVVVFRFVSRRFGFS